MDTKGEKAKIIDDFIEKLKNQSANDLHWRVEGDIGDILEHFAISCKKCGSSRIYVSWEQGVDYGEYTGYSEGQKLFKCLDCGNAASFWELLRTMKWTGGKHNYHGKYNSSSKRKMSKIYKGLKVDFKELKKVLSQLGKEINN